jgi:hypothetical protein
VLATPALGRLIRGRVRPLISLAYPAARPGPAPGPRRPHEPSPGPRAVLGCTAAQYSNEADQHRPRTAASGQRRAETTPIDHPARSSGRRGRGFKSRHPDAGTASVGVPSRRRVSLAWLCPGDLGRLGHPLASRPSLVSVSYPAGQQLFEPVPPRLSCARPGGTRGTASWDHLCVITGADCPRR